MCSYIHMYAMFSLHLAIMYRYSYIAIAKLISYLCNYGFNFGSSYVATYVAAIYVKSEATQI